MADLLSTIINGTRRGFQRLAVDTGQTSFFEGREFRTFKEWGSSTTINYVIKAVVPVNTILISLDLELDFGSARVETVAGGTEGGAFSEILPVFSANNMSEKPQPPIVPQNLLSAGGTHSGGTVLDVFRVNAANNANKATSVGGSSESIRGVGIGTYYFRITLTEAVGVFKSRWEERE